MGLATVDKGVSRSELVSRLVPAYVDALKQLKVRSQLLNHLLEGDGGVLTSLGHSIIGVVMVMLSMHSAFCLPALSCGKGPGHNLQG